MAAKHQSYESENEIRLTLVDGKYRGFYFDAKRETEEVKHHDINNQQEVTAVTSEKEKIYTESEIFIKQCIKEIYLGPRCDSNLKNSIIIQYIKQINNIINVRNLYEFL